MIVEDESSTASFIALGDVGEKLTGTLVSRLALIGDLDQYILPEPIKKKLIGQKTLFAINLITKDTDSEEITFRVNSSRILDVPQPPAITLSITASPEVEPSTQLTKKQLRQEEEEHPSSPPPSQIQKRSFP
ncbi:hypothetical protein PTKIN_Ptkin03bG0238700 [Pterospermum kingtungense]